MVARFFAKVAAITLAFLAVLNFGNFLSGTPAFDETARAEGIFGDWRIPFSPALYNRADYLFQLGYGYVNADTLASAATEASDELADVGTSLDRSSDASVYLEESLALAPANAHAWATLAWSHGLQGDLEASRDALQASWLLAPYNLELSLSRLSLIEILVLPIADEDTLAELDALAVEEGDVAADEEENVLFDDLLAETIALSENEEAAVMRDLETFRRFNPRSYEALLEDVELFAELSVNLPDLPAED